MSNLKLVGQEPDKKVIDLLEDALQDAKSGKLRGVIIVGVHQDGGSMSYRHGPSDKLVFAVHLALHRIMTAENANVETIKETP